MSHRQGLHSDDSPYPGEPLCYCDEKTPTTSTPTDLDNSIIGCCGGGLNRHEVCSHVKDYIQAEIVKARKEATDASLRLALNTMKDTFRRLFTYEILYGKIEDMDNRDVTKELVRYQELEPERIKFANWYEAKLTALKEGLKG